MLKESLIRSKKATRTLLFQILKFLNFVYKKLYLVLLNEKRQLSYFKWKDTVFVTVERY